MALSSSSHAESFFPPCAGSVGPRLVTTIIASRASISPLAMINRLFCGFVMTSILFIVQPVGNPGTIVGGGKRNCCPAPGRNLICHSLIRSIPKQLPREADFARGVVEHIGRALGESLQTV